MSEINQFPSRIETGFGERKLREVKEVEKEEFHMPHSHPLTSFQKFITVAEILFLVWVFYLIFTTVVKHLLVLNH